MELVYLWIEKYKNILKQGFYLNPVYREELVNINDNEIEIILKENKNYENPFGEHFNIITIVGKNGSGKTNLINVLSSIIRTISNNLNEKRNNKNDYDIIDCPEKFCLITREGSNYIAYCSDPNLFNLKIKSNNGVTLKAKKEDSLKPTPFEKRELITHKNKKINVAKFQPFIKIEDTYAPDFPLWNDIYGISKHKLKNYFYYDRFRLYDTVRNIIEFMRFERSLPQNKKFKVLEENPQLQFDLYSPYINIYDALQWTNSRVQKIKSENYPITQTVSRSFSTLSANVRKNSYKDIDSLLNSNVFQKLFFGYALGEILTIINNKNIKKTIRDSLIDKLTDISNCTSFPNSEERKNFYDKIIGIVTHKRIKELLQSYIDFEGDEKGNSESKDILRNYYKVVENKEFGGGTIVQLKTIDDMSNLDISTHKKEIIKIEKLKGISKNLYKKSKINDNIVYDFLSLSTGEQRILRFLSDVYFIAKTGGYIRDKDTNIETNIFIFDEMDLSWHPEWQRKMIYYIKDIFDNIIPLSSKRKVNLIFTTHSPFILSDMPQENVILLDKNSDTGLCEIKQSKTKTFGSNIHTLFANSFFMESTIGQFADKKIKEAAKFLQNKDSEFKNIDEVEQFIRLIDNNNILGKILSSMYELKDKQEINEKNY